MSAATDHARPLPTTVIARDSATDGAFGGCHGAAASGLRWPDGWHNDGVDSMTQSLIELADDMQHQYTIWRREQGHTS